MHDEKLYQIWVYLQSEPLFWLTLTLGAYITGEKVYKSFKLFPLFNPVAISIIIISAILIFFNVSIDEFSKLSIKNKLKFEFSDSKTAM